MRLTENYKFGKTHFSLESVENDIMMYDKIQIVQLFTNYFVNIVDNVPEIT